MADTPKSRVKLNPNRQVPPWIPIHVKLNPDRQVPPWILIHRPWWATGVCRGAQRVEIHRDRGNSSTGTVQRRCPRVGHKRCKDFKIVLYLALDPFRDRV